MLIQDVQVKTQLMRALCAGSNSMNLYFSMLLNQMNVFEIKVCFGYNIVKITLKSAKNGCTLDAPVNFGWVNVAPSSGWCREQHSEIYKEVTKHNWEVFFRFISK